MLKFILVGFLLIGIGVGLYLVSRPTVFKPKALENDYSVNLRETSDLVACPGNSNALLATFTNPLGSTQHFCFTWPLAPFNGSNGQEGLQTNIISGDFSFYNGTSNFSGTINSGLIKFPYPFIDFGCGAQITSITFQFTDTTGRTGIYTGCIDDLREPQVPKPFPAWGTYQFDGEVEEEPSSQPSVSIPPPTLTVCPTLGDANDPCDGQVTIADFTIWKEELLGSRTTTRANFNPEVDDRVTVADFIIWKEEFFNKL